MFTGAEDAPAEERRSPLTDPGEFRLLPDGEFFDLSCAHLLSGWLITDDDAGSVQILCNLTEVEVRYEWFQIYIIEGGENESA